MTSLSPASIPSHSAFLIKLWIDDTAGDEGPEEMDRTLTWRGQIQHVQTGESRAFRGPFQMLAFMDRFLVPRKTAE
ncbi:MAG: hypothetical protein KKA73_19410 [Chloroflexi bacterium]|nr:hypothetical protein [Chloroflexota bacterium]MBU1749855.1 hypothetical protein [Chloroflexota bacterium]